MGASAVARTTSDDVTHVVAERLGPARGEEVPAAVLGENRGAAPHAVAVHRKPPPTSWRISGSGPRSVAPAAARPGVRAGCTPTAAAQRGTQEHERHRRRRESGSFRLPGFDVGPDNRASAATWDRAPPYRIAAIAACFLCRSSAPSRRDGASGRELAAGGAPRPERDGVLVGRLRLAPAAVFPLLELPARGAPAAHLLSRRSHEQHATSLPPPAAAARRRRALAERLAEAARSAPASTPTAAERRKRCATPNHCAPRCVSGGARRRRWRGRRRAAHIAGARDIALGMSASEQTRASASAASASCTTSARGGRRGA